MRTDPLVKCIWANLMLGWISRQFNCPIALIVRHPGAVIESELRSGWDAESVLERFKADTRLHELTGGRYRSLLARQLTPIEALAARWIIENQWAIENASLNNVTVVYYELLSTSPESTWELMRRALNLRQIPDTTLLAKPSQQSAAPEHDIAASEVGYPRWQRVLSDSDKHQIQSILDQCHCDFYSMSEAQPRTHASVVAINVTPGDAR
jgi:hypothetical protein